MAARREEANEDDPHADALQAYLDQRRQRRKAGGNDDDGAKVGSGIGTTGLSFYPDEQDALALFLALTTQWRKMAVVGFGGGQVVYTGLDYGAILPTASMAGISLTPALFGDLQIMEAAAMKEFAR